MKIVFLNMSLNIGTVGLPNVVTYLEKKGYPSKHVYLTEGCKEANNAMNEELNSILSFIQQDKPDLIGFSLMTLNFFRTKRLTLEIKKRFPDIPIIWGGIHPSFNPDESIQFADYICVGEGEDATLELVQHLEKGLVGHNIPNIWMKRDGQVVKNDVRSLIQNLDDYPFPQINWDNTYCLDKGEIKRLTHNLYQKYAIYGGVKYDVFVSRGCPYACSYCCNSLFRKMYKNKGEYIRYRSVDNVIRELRHAKKNFPYINVIEILDDGFGNTSEAYLKEFSEKYKQAIGLPLRLKIVPTNINEEKMRYLAGANTLVVMMGLQANDRINKTVFNRHAISEQFLKVTKLIKKYNMVGRYDLILQNPYFIEQDMVEICEILARIPKPYRLKIFHLGLFPNTPLREKAIEDGIKVNDLDGYMTPYGDYPEKFPVLRSIVEICPYTPKVLIHFFLNTRNSLWGRILLRTYRFFIYNTLEGTRKIIMKNTALVRFIKKLVFLQVAFPKLIKGKVE